MKNSTLEVVKTQVFAPGDSVKVTTNQFSGLTGIVKDKGTFSCMGGAYTLSGVKVQLNGIAGPVILQESQLERYNPVEYGSENCFFAEMVVI